MLHANALTWQAIEGSSPLGAVMYWSLGVPQGHIKLSWSNGSCPQIWQPVMFWSWYMLHPESWDYMADLWNCFRHQRGLPFQEHDFALWDCGNWYNLELTMQESHIAPWTTLPCRQWIWTTHTASGEYHHSRDWIWWILTDFLKFCESGKWLTISH